MDWVNLPHRIACFQKLGDNLGLKMWKKRYFRLNEDKLLYSKTRDFSDSKGCILLNEIISVKSSENPTLLRGHIEGILGGTGGYFEIGVEGRIYYLWAENVKERDEWISILTRVKTYYDTIKEYSKKEKWSFRYRYKFIVNKNWKIKIGNGEIEKREKSRTN